MTETHQVKCELIAIRVPEEVANERRRKLIAKHKEQSWLAPSEEYKALQDWTILVTNLPEEPASNRVQSAIQQGTVRHPTGYSP